MIKMRRSNLQSFCRTCLDHFQSSPTASSNFNISQTPNLTKLLIVCTSLNINEDTDGIYPQSLCKKCYDTMQQFRDFRDMAQQSAEVLREIVLKKDGEEQEVVLTEKELEDQNAASNSAINEDGYLNDTSDSNNPEIKMEFEVHEILEENNITNNKTADTTDDYANDSDSSAPTTSTAKKRKIPDNTDNEKFLCKFYGCNTEFKTLQSLDDHIVSQHATEFVQATKDKMECKKLGRPLMQAKEYQPYNSCYKAEMRPIADIRFDKIGHFPPHDNINHATRCKLQHCTGKSRIQCSKCQRRRNVKHEISNIDMDESENSNTSMNISETFERQEPESTAASSSTSAVPTSYASLSRLNFLDGTFFKYVPEESTDSSIVAMCMKCWPHSVKLRGYNNCSSNFLSHLKRKHGQECVQEYKIHLQHKKKEKVITDNDTSGSDKKRWTKFIPKQILTNLEQFNTNITKFFIHSMIPLEIVEDPYFIRTFTDLENGLKVMNKKELKFAIENYYVRQINKIKAELHNDYIDNICTTADIWSSNSDTIVVMSAHWVTAELTRKSITLDCKRYRNIPSHERILKTAKAVNAYFNLNENKIVASLTNNGSNLVEMFKALGVNLFDSDMIDNEENKTQSTESLPPEEIGKCLATIPGHLNYFAYILTLCATMDAIKVLKAYDTPLSNMHKNVMQKCVKLWIAACRPETEEITQQILQCTLQCPDESNFNTIFNALEQISKLKEKMLKLQQVLNMPQPFEEAEYQYIQEYLVCTTPIAKALEIIQSDENSFYGYVLPTLMALRLKFQKIQKKKDFVYCNALVKAYEESIAIRFECYYKLITQEAENAALAALSHPRFKDSWLTCLGSSDAEGILKIFKSAISKAINENLNETVDIDKKPSISKCDDSWFDFGSDSDSDDSLTVTNQLQLYKANLMMTNFFAEKSQHVEILHRYPEIKAIFIKHNTPLSSSRLLEIPFLLTTMHNMSSDPELFDEMFEKRALLKCNLDN